MTDKFPIPDINVVKETMAIMSNLDIENETIDNIKKYVKILMNGYISNGYFIDSGLELFRGIKYFEKPHYFDEIIYPPENKAKRNRASDEKEQMFYASSTKRPIFYELNLNPGDTLVLTTWCLNNRLLFHPIGYTKSSFEKLNSKRNPPDIFNINKENSINEIIADFLANTFCQYISEEKNYLYKLTIAIAKIHLSNTINSQSKPGNVMSGLVYPTIQLNGEEENFAITKSTIDKGLLDFIRAEFIQVIGKDQDRYRYKIIDVSDGGSSGKINWMNLDKHWSVHDDSKEIYFSKESGQFNAFNEEGDEIEPDKT